MIGFEPISASSIGRFGSSACDNVHTVCSRNPVSVLPGLYEPFRDRKIAIILIRHKGSLMFIWRPVLQSLVTNAKPIGSRRFSAIGPRATRRRF